MFVIGKFYNHLYPCLIFIFLMTVEKIWGHFPDMLSLKKKWGQRARTTFHSSILRACRVIFAAMHKEKN